MKENFDYFKEQQDFEKLDWRRKQNVLENSQKEAELMNSKIDFAKSLSEAEKLKLREIAKQIFPQIEDVSDEDLFHVNRVLERMEKWNNSNSTDESYKELDQEIRLYFLKSAKVSSEEYQKEDVNDLKKVYMHLFENARNNIDFVALTEWPFLEKYNPNNIGMSDSLVRNSITMVAKLLYESKNRFKESELKIKDVSNEEISHISKFILEVLSQKSFPEKNINPDYVLNEYLKSNYGIDYNELEKLYEIYKSSKTVEEFMNKVSGNYEELTTRNELEAKTRRESLKEGGLNKVIKNVRDISMPTGFVGSYSEIVKNQKNKEFFDTILKDRPVIDLGCGPAPDSVIGFAQECGALKYVAVEKYNIQELNQYYSRDKFIELEESDMLEFVFNQADESANISMNGIDLSIFNTDNENNKEYVKVLIGEIARVVPKGGVAFGYNSPFLSMLSGYGFKKIKLEEDKDFMSLEVWQKNVKA